jgi:short-subunit dehydrogenase
VHFADLTRLSEMRRVAAEIDEQEPRVDVLINSAGAMLWRAASQRTALNAVCAHRLRAQRRPYILRPLRRWRT